MLQSSSLLLAIASAIPIFIWVPPNPLFSHQFFLRWSSSGKYLKDGFSSMDFSGRVQQCHLHHPPVITIFTGGINHSKWVVKMVLFYLHPIDTAIFGALVEARRHTLAMTAVVAIERWRPWENFWTTEVWGTKPLDWFGGFTWYALICWAIIGWFPVLASGFAGIQTDI